MHPGLMAAITSQQNTGIVVSAGLFAYYPCNEGTGDTIVDKIGGIGDMVFTGPVSWGASWLSLPGTSAGHTTRTYTTTANQGITYCACIRIPAANSAYGCLFEVRVQPGAFTLPMLWIGNDDKLLIDESSDYVSPSSVADTWVHVIISKPSDTSTATYYINGVSDAGATSYAVATKETAFFRRAPNLFYCYCDVRRIRWYNRAVDATEAAAIYSADGL